MAKVCPFNKYKGDVECINGNYWILNLDMVESNSGRVLDKLYQPIEKIGNSTILFNENYVLYSKLRPYLNKVVIPDSTGYATSEMISMQTGSEINKYFLASLLRSDSFVSYINSKTAGAKMPRVSMDHLREFELIIPSIEQQNKFAQFVEQIDKSKFIVQKEIKDLQELLDKKMDEYFRQ